MPRKLALLLITGLLVMTGLLIFSSSVWAEQPAAAESHVTISTTLGDITIELSPQAAPQTVAHFLKQAQSHFYNGLVFHRVIDGFVIQTGGYWFDLRFKEPKFGTVNNESSNGLSNLRGTVAMARGNDPDSADAQFYINLQNNTHLDTQDDRLGYTVFGRVIDGMDVVDQIGQTPTHRRSPQLAHVPVEPIQIQSIRMSHRQD